ncbi:MAG: hypothetical protein ABII79_09485 [bacterium]
MSTGSGTEEKKQKRSKHRSPNYPAIGLERALELARKQHDVDGAQKIPIRIAHERWGYKPGGSPGDLMLAALKAYGLTEVEGSGEKRRVALTELARKIFLDHPDRAKIIQDIALAPNAHREIWDHFGGDLPRDDVLKDYLIWELKFNDKSVDSFISQFRGTISFAKLDKSDILPIETESHGGSGSPEPQTSNSFGEQMNAVVAPKPVSALVSTTGPKVLVTRDFSIPRKAGRLAILRLEYPISSQDIDQIRSWLDLMGNTISDDEELSD